MQVVLKLNQASLLALLYLFDKHRVLLLMSATVLAVYHVLNQTKTHISNIPNYFNYLQN
jgi:hypothetical protein